MRTEIAGALPLAAASLIWSGVVYAAEHRTIPVGSNTAPAFSPDGRFLAAAGKDRDRLDRGVQIWEPGLAKEAASVQIPGMCISSTAFSVDGKRLALAARGFTSVNLVPGATAAKWARSASIELVEVGSWKRKGALEIADGVGTMAFSPDGKYLAVTWRMIQLWDIVNKKVAKEIPELASHISFSPDGKLLATCSREHGVRIWDLDTLAMKFSHREHKSLPIKVTFSPDGKTVASSESGGGRVILWKFATDEFQTFNMFGTGKALRKINNVTGLAFSRDGRWLAVLGHEAIDFIDVANRTLWQYPGRWDDSCRYGVVFSPDGKTLATSGARVVKLWDFEKLLTEKSPDHEMKRPPKPAPPPPPDLK